MADRIFMATASDLMTRNLEGKSEEKMAGVVFDWMKTNEYTAAPLYSTDSGEPIGYVEADWIDERTADIGTYASEFNLSTIISTGAEFQELLRALTRRSYYFLGGADQLTGILTRSDLNKSAAYIHLYDRIAYLEQLLRDQMTSWDQDWRSCLNDGAIRSLEGRRENQKGLNLDLIYYTGFSHLVTVAVEANFFADTNFTSESNISDVLSRIKNIRNDVAHSKPILQVEEIQSESDSRDIRDLLKIYTDLLTAIETIEAERDSETIETRTRSVTTKNRLHAIYGDTCQICGPINNESDHGSTVEMAHILPLKDENPDRLENILSLCPEHHRMFDRAQIIIDPDTYQIDQCPDPEFKGDQLKVNEGHTPSTELIRAWNALNS